MRLITIMLLLINLWYSSCASTISEISPDYSSSWLDLSRHEANWWRNSWAHEGYNDTGLGFKNNGRSWDGRIGFTALGSFAAWDLGPMNGLESPTIYYYPWFTGVSPWFGP